MPKKFTASFDGECSQCFDPIEAGDEIGYVDDEICCETCFDSFWDWP